MQVSVSKSVDVDIDDETADFITAQHIKNSYYAAESLLNDEDKDLLQKAYTYFSGKQLD